jgi:hypothetical protein
LYIYILGANETHLMTWECLFKNIQGEVVGLF